MTTSKELSGWDPTGTVFKVRVHRWPVIARHGEKPDAPVTRTAKPLATLICDAQVFGGNLIVSFGWNDHRVFARKTGLRSARLRNTWVIDPLSMRDLETQVEAAESNATAYRARLPGGA